MRQTRRCKRCRSRSLILITALFSPSSVLLPFPFRRSSGHDSSLHDLTPDVKHFSFLVLLLLVLLLLSLQYFFSAEGRSTRRKEKEKVQLERRRRKQRRERRDGGKAGREILTLFQVKAECSELFERGKEREREGVLTRAEFDWPSEVLSS